MCGHGQRDDVFRGVVFDGFDSVFASSYVHTLHSVLKALNNRKHIFAITLKNDFTTIKQLQKRLQAEKGRCLCYKKYLLIIFIHNKTGSTK